MAVIWTNHLYERIKQRGLNPADVDLAVRHPDQVVTSSTTNSNKHIKHVNGQKITAAVKRQGADFVITSAWWEPSYGARHSNKFFLEVLIDKFVRWLESKIVNSSKK